ncbi:alpha/beta hydrolase fold domain-containing protein [Streptomyces sp. NPDC059982]
MSALEISNSSKDNGAAAQQWGRSHPLASPVFADLTGLPPLLVQARANEVLLDDAVRLTARAGAADVEATLEIGPGLPHVYQSKHGRLPEANTASECAARLLSSPRPAPVDRTRRGGARLASRLLVHGAQGPGRGGTPDAPTRSTAAARGLRPAEGWGARLPGGGAEGSTRPVWGKRCECCGRCVRAVVPGL